MLDLFAQAHGLGGAVEVAGDDVPAHPATAQVIEGRHAPGEQVRRFVGEVGGEAEAEVSGHRGHGRDQQQRVVDRQLDRLFERDVHRLLVDVVDADDVGDEQPSNSPRSSNCASSVQYSMVLYWVEVSRGWVHRPWLMCPMQFMLNALSRIFFLAIRWSPAAAGFHR
jgi:hypothetical protein